jgi:hypothetical protein
MLLATPIFAPKLWAIGYAVRRKTRANPSLCYDAGFWGEQTKIAWSIGTSAMICAMHKSQAMSARKIVMRLPA